MCSDKMSEQIIETSFLYKSQLIVKKLKDESLKCYCLKFMFS